MRRAPEKSRSSGDDKGRRAVAGADAGLSLGVVGSGDTGGPSSAFCCRSLDSIASLTTSDGGICDCACSVLTGNSAKTSARVNVTSCQYSPPAFDTSIRRPVRASSAAVSRMSIHSISVMRVRRFAVGLEISPRQPVALIFLEPALCQQGLLCGVNAPVLHLAAALANCQRYGQAAMRPIPTCVRKPIIPRRNPCDSFNKCHMRIGHWAIP